MTILIGEVISIKGVKITLRLFEESSKDTLFFEGKKFKGVSIREYISIQRGFRDIICIVEGENLDESRSEDKNNKTNYIRKVEVKPIGYYQNDIFHDGVKYLPMIKDPAFLVPEEKVAKMYHHDQNTDFIIGEMLNEEIPISLPWSRLFNTHIGIFGNTGSGKSNTLAKLYTVLFDKKKESLRGKSQFVLLDFNGEYIRDQLIESQDKFVLQLNTREISAAKFNLALDEFWSADTLCILFKATTNTQTPFLNRIVNGRNRYIHNPSSLENYLKTTFKKVFITSSQKRESVNLLITIMKVIENQTLFDCLNRISWNSTNNSFYIDDPNGKIYFNGGEIDNGRPNYITIFENNVQAISLPSLNSFDELTIRINLQLINDLLSGYVQFDHIQPLLKRIEASSFNLQRVIEVGGAVTSEKLLTVISLRKCNQETKKLMPLLIAKHYYNQHRNSVENPPNKTIHLIIDEAHNVVSQQSIREQESWKDYRLELFEEIIKEGRKFGVFLTLSSQRPAEISPTIMSQIHNFFIHRLVNEKDLFLLDNSISTLDALSKSLIPNLSKGCCVVTGTSFDLPLVLQVKILPRDGQPDSEDVDLTKLWK